MYFLFVLICYGNFLNEGVNLLMRLIWISKWFLELINYLGMEMLSKIICRVEKFNDGFFCWLVNKIVCVWEFF